MSDPEPSVIYVADLIEALSQELGGPISFSETHYWVKQSPHQGIETRGVNGLRDATGEVASIHFGPRDPSGDRPVVAVVISDVLPWIKAQRVARVARELGLEVE